MGRAPKKHEGFRILCQDKGRLYTFIAERDGKSAEISIEFPGPLPPKIRNDAERMAIAHWYALRELERIAARQSDLRRRRESALETSGGPDSDP